MNCGLLLLVIRTVLLKHISANALNASPLWIDQLPINFICPRKKTTSVKKGPNWISTENQPNQEFNVYQQTVQTVLTIQPAWHHSAANLFHYSVANLFQPGGQVHGILKHPPMVLLLLYGKKHRETEACKIANKITDIFFGLTYFG